MLRGLSCSSTVLIVAALTLAPPPARAELAPIWMLSWGSFGHTDLKFDTPNDIHLDATGSVYVADYHNHCIKKFDPSGTFILKMGYPGYGSGGFDGPWSVGVDASGTIYVSDAGNDLVQVFSPGGTFLRQWHLPAPTPDYTIDVIALDVSAAGDVYVSDSWNNIHQFTSDGTWVRRWPIHGVPFTTSHLAEIAVAPNGDVYAYDTEDRAIRHFDANGNPLGEIFGSGVPDAWIGGRTGFSVDAAGGLWTSAGDEARHFDASGALLSRWGTTGTGPGQFKGVNGLVSGADGVVYVVDKYNSRIQKFGPAPTDAARTSWGQLKARYRH